ncbi:MAG: LysR family transcriptional regulator [Gammaproteobacteria bacterium]|nr:LysR family transcriptional regulator [Gammaproteobacteria bacterium]
MNVTLKQIRAFVAIAQTSSFAQASELVHLSQPALSISIKNLEQSIGGQLFARTTRSVVLTPEGKTFFPIAKRLLTDWDAAFSDLNNLFALNRGTLTMAAMPSFASTLLPAHIQQYHQQYPAINIKVHDVIAEDSVAMIRSGEAEFAVSFDPGVSDDLDFEPLFTDRFIVALPAKHPLVKQQEIHWQDIANEPFILLQRPSSIRQLIEQALLEQGIELQVEFEANQLATIGQMVATGLGVSAMPALCQTQLHSLGVICRPIAEPTVSRRVGIITSHRAPLSLAAQEFKQLISRAYPT